MYTRIDHICNNSACVRWNVFSLIYFIFPTQNVILSAVTPQVGPLSGGTQLAITGSHLNIGSHTTAYLDELPCHINSTQATSSRITCITSRASMPRPVRTLTLIIDGANRTLTGHPFKYKSDPVIAEIKPLMSFMSGGRVITVHGTNFDTIQNPEMVVFVNSDFHYPVNKTVIELRFFNEVRVVWNMSIKF